MKKTYLITGGSGFIGSYFNDALDGTIINYDIREPIHPNANIYEKGDIRDTERLKEVIIKHKPSLIINLAASHHDFGITREGYFDVNENGMQVICDVAANNNITDIVFYSSVAVYGESAIASNEESDTTPSNDYGDSKLAAEHVLNKWIEADSLRKGLIIRPVLVHGARNTANMYNLIRQIDSGLYANIGSGKKIKSICYVENIVEATLWAWERFEEGLKTYNYADQPQLTSNDAVEIIRKELGKRKPIRVPMWLGLIGAIPFDLYIKITGRNFPVSSARIKKLDTGTEHNADKIASEGFKARFSNEEGLVNMVKWYKSTY